LSSSHCLLPLVRRWSAYAELAPDDRDAVLALPFTRKSFAKDGYIVREGQQSRECALILSGFAFRQKLIRNGGRQIISIHIPTEFVDLQNSLLGVADHSVQSLGPSEVALVPRSAILSLRETRPAIGLAMWTETLIDSSIFREWVVNVGRRDSKARIAHLLCELAVRLDRISGAKGGAYDFPLTQEQLADATGLTPVHTNRTLQTLRKNGLIELNGRSLKVLDWAGLREAGDFDELYLHQQLEADQRASGAA